MLTQPVVQIEVIVLLAPQHASQGLAHDACFVFRRRGRRYRSVESVRFLYARCQSLVKRLAEGKASPAFSSSAS
jgi:hypothetical protein